MTGGDIGYDRISLAEVKCGTFDCVVKIFKFLVRICACKSSISEPYLICYYHPTMPAYQCDSKISLIRSWKSSTLVTTYKCSIRFGRLARMMSVPSSLPGYKAEFLQRYSRWGSQNSAALNQNLRGFHHTSSTLETFTVLICSERFPRPFAKSHHRV